MKKKKGVVMIAKLTKQKNNISNHLNISENPDNIDQNDSMKDSMLNWSWKGYKAWYLHRMIVDANNKLKQGTPKSRSKKQEEEIYKE